jgi:ABC-type multidrug transport system fused ATPase/permease subunit
VITREEAQLFAHYLRPYKYQIGKVSVLAVICAFFEAVNLGALVPLLQMLNSSTAPGGTFWDILRSIFGLFGLELNFVNLLIVMGIIFLIGQVLLYHKKQVQTNLWFAFSADLKMSVFEKLLNTDIRYHYSERSGKFMDILNRQIEYATTSIFAVTEIVTFIFFIFVYISILIYISLPLTIICIIIAISCLYFLNFQIKQSKVIGIRANEINIRMNEFITERLGLLKLVKVSSTESLEVGKLQKISDEYVKDRTDFRMNGVKIETSFQIIIFALALSILYISVIILNLPIAMLLVFIFILIRLTDPLRQINAQRHELGGELATLEAIDRTMRETAAHETISSGTQKFETVNDQIELSHVIFSYTDSNPVIKDVSFTIKRKEMVAIIGESGGGKSTIVDLIIRLIEPDTGNISIDGIDIRNFDIREYHRKIGLVSQDSFIFNDSVINNICYGSDTISMERAIGAATTANAHDFIMQLPEGYHSGLGERGVTLSGGEKQRISLARAIYKDPEILILDEATSALDSDTERVIQQAILSIKNKYTIIVIAHRLSTIENSDKIVVIENGQVAETGTHKELIDKSGSYAKYYHIQYKSAHSNT